MTAGRHFWRWLLLIWIGVSVGLILMCRSSIAGFRFADPDDVMRLVEVRDWLGGQSWFDVSQHRMNPPDGLSMHWSRLLDVPIGAVIALSRLFVAERPAETIAAVVIPMLTLGSVMALMAALTRRWASPLLALFAAAMCASDVGVWFAMPPMRIDHHGWQISAGLGIALALTARPTRANAAIAGLCAALWTHISLEGLPFAAVGGAWLGVRAMMGERADGDRLSAYLAALTIAAALLLLGIKGPAGFAGLRCDAIGTLHIAAFGILTIASQLAARVSRPQRIAILIAGAGVAGLVYRLNIGVCMAGPFGQLGPLGQHLWYRSVNEGVPLWQLSPGMAVLYATLPIVGFAGAVFAFARTTDPASRASLLTYIVLLTAAMGIGVFVTRASAFSNLLAMPGAMLALAAILKAMEQASRPVRIPVVTLAMILCTPLGAALASVLVTAERAPRPHPASPPAQPCGAIDDFAVLDRLPATIMLTSIDAGPALIAGSHHRTITGPYHRDPQALEDVLRFFTLPPDQARGIAKARHADYLALCPGGSDLGAMAKYAPSGLAAALQRGPVSWLTPVTLGGGGPLRLYRIDAPPSSATASISTR